MGENIQNVCKGKKNGQILKCEQYVEEGGVPLTSIHKNYIMTQC